MTPIESAIASSYENRVMAFITSPDSEAVQMFAQPLQGTTGDWYGEHTGKWLCTAALAWKRLGDPILKERIVNVVDFLAGQQETSGYLGTYAPDAGCRFTDPNAAGGRTWDVWNLAWTLSGLIQVAHLIGLDQAKEVAEKAANALLKISPSQVVQLGNHQGLSSAVIIEPLALLTELTQDTSFAAFAKDVLADLQKEVGELSAIDDVADLGTGKAYQICWLLNGVLSLAKVCPEVDANAVTRLWQNIADHHLSALGGPWGGIATHKEVFNKQGFFSPDGLTETCTTQMWMRLCARLYHVTGSEAARHAWTLALHNALLGALDENGSDWCYFTFPNGRRNNTYQWACCKSSGALALEEAADFAIDMPQWPVTIQIHKAVDKLDHHGQEIVRREYVAVQYGPYVYATGPLDGYKKSETLCIPQMFPENCFELTDEGSNGGQPSIRCKPIGRTPFLMRPYYEAGGRHDGAWRTTWLEVAWQ